MNSNSPDFFYSSYNNNILGNNLFPKLTTNDSNNFNAGGQLFNNSTKELINKNGMIAKSYYRKLISERDYLYASNMSSRIPATIKVLQAEIEFLENLFDLNYLNCSFTLPPPQGMVEVRVRKIYIPVDKYPDYNFVGRILGPRGLTAKDLEQRSGCKIMIRGRGSMKDKSKERNFIGRQNYQHLNEPLHVLLQAEDTLNRVQKKLDYAENEIRKMLSPTSGNTDNLKKSQLVKLALLNGTYRESGSLTASTTLSPSLNETYQPFMNYFNSLESVNNFYSNSESSSIRNLASSV
uniref:Protein quaking (inferred by orthology to a human protein) n=1 Tax=Strongyloides venezuelensis TaxID=75913 RepID=A0A0K0F7P4_STRVS